MKRAMRVCLKRPYADSYSALSSGSGMIAARTAQEIKQRLEQAFGNYFELVVNYQISAHGTRIVFDIIFVPRARFLPFIRRAPRKVISVIANSRGTGWVSDDIECKIHNEAVREVAVDQLAECAYHNEFVVA